VTSLYALTSHALPADALCGLDEDSPDCTSIDRIARAVEASGYGEATAHRTAILRALGEHLRAQYTDAREALRWLATIDRRLATWGACACAREVLRFVPEGEERPRLAIEAIERWLAGQAKLDEVSAARRSAWAAWTDDYVYAASAAHAAVHAAHAAHAADTAADAAAASSVSAKNWGTLDWGSARNAELTRLVGVVADALPGLPPETT